MLESGDEARPVQGSAEFLLLISTPGEYLLLRKMYADLIFRIYTGTLSSRNRFWRTSASVRSMFFDFPLHPFLAPFFSFCNFFYSRICTLRERRKKIKCPNIFSFFTKNMFRRFFFPPSYSERRSRTLNGQTTTDFSSNYSTRFRRLIEYKKVKKSWKLKKGKYSTVLVINDLSFSARFLLHKVMTLFWNKLNFFVCKIVSIQISVWNFVICVFCFVFF